MCDYCGEPRPPATVKHRPNIESDTSRKICDDCYDFLVGKRPPHAYPKPKARTRPDR